MNTYLIKTHIYGKEQFVELSEDELYDSGAYIRKGEIVFMVF